MAGHGVEKTGASSVQRNRSREEKCYKNPARVVCSLYIASGQMRARVEQATAGLKGPAEWDGPTTRAMDKIPLINRTELCTADVQMVR